MNRFLSFCYTYCNSVTERLQVNLCFLLFISRIIHKFATFRLLPVQIDNTDCYADVTETKRAPVFTGAQSFYLTLGQTFANVTRTILDNQDKGNQTNQNGSYFIPFVTVNSKGQWCPNPAGANNP